MSVYALERVRGTVRLYLHRPSKVAQLRAERTFYPVICLLGGSDCISMNTWASPPVLDAAKEAHFSLGPSGVLNPELHTAGQEKTGRMTDRTLGRH